MLCDMGMMINRRRVCGGGKSLPYDAEIEYLESTGTQYIDTMLPAMDSYVVNCDVMALSSAQMCIFGAGVLTPASYNGFFVDTQSKRKRLALFYPKRTYYRTTNDNSFDKNIKYSLEITLANTNICRINGTVQELRPQNDSNFGNNYIVYTMHLFNMIREGENILGFIGRIYNFSVVNSTSLETLIDFIPVRIGTTGYMYDKVSKQLFGNAGTGDFILGPDK